MDIERHTIRSARGVDEPVVIAGPGSRSYAFIIDWHIRLIGALAWIGAALIAENGRLAWTTTPGKAGRVAMLIVLMPALAVYFLYHPIIELFMRGQTPGKRAAGVRIVNSDGGIPRSGAILVRNLFRLVDSLPGLYVVGLLTTIVSAQRVRIGDMAAGTLLVVDEPPPAPAPTEIGAAANSTAGADDSRDDRIMSELAAQILDRWPGLDADKRCSIARQLLTKHAGPGEAARIARLPDGGLRMELTKLARRGTPDSTRADAR